MQRIKFSDSGHAQRIVTKEVTKNKEHRGWKVYIDGSKFPKKPVDFYKDMTEAQAIMQAQEEYRNIHERAGKAPGKARITDSCDNPVNIPQPIKILQTDRLFTDSPDAGDPSCICSRCGLVIPEGIGIIRAYPVTINAVGGVPPYTYTLLLDGAIKAGSAAPTTNMTWTANVTFGEGIGAWPEHGEGEYRYHPACLGAV